jgi:hypothetical protein
MTFKPQAGNTPECNIISRVALQEIAIQQQPQLQAATAVAAGTPSTCHRLRDACPNKCSQLENTFLQKSANTPLQAELQHKNSSQPVPFQPAGSLPLAAPSCAHSLEATGAVHSGSS